MTRSMQIRRPNSLLDIIYTIYESGEKINEINCTFKSCDDPAQITTYKHGIRRYRFYKKHLTET